MALQLKVDTEDVPSIFKILGLDSGSSDALASAAGGDSSKIPPANIAAPPPQGTMPPPSSVPTKLGRLQQIIQASQGNADHPTMTDGFNGPPPDNYVMQDSGGAPTPPAVPPAGPISPQPVNTLPAMGAGAPAVKGTFQDQHPTLYRILKGLATTAEGGVAGTGAMTFGQGFGAAHEITDPARKAMEQATLAEKQAGTAHTKAATEQMSSQVTLPNGLTVPFALASKLYPTLTTEQGKNTRAQAALDSKESIQAGKDAIALRSKGLKPNPNGGAPIPLTRDEMSETEQASLDLKQSQQDAASARAELDRQKNDPNSAAYKAAMGRLQVAAKNAQTAAGRLGLAKDTFNANYFGIGPTGAALSGAQIDEKTGQPIGPRMANAGKVSADRLKRGDLAANAIHNLNNVEEIIGRRGDDLFGPIMGRISNIRDMVGSDDPDLAAIGTEIHNYALASNGAHGVRSQQAVEKTEDEILKQMKRGTNGAMGGIRAAKDSLLDFVKDQQLGSKARPASPTAQPQATHVYNPATGAIAPIGR